MRFSQVILVMVVASVASADQTKSDLPVSTYSFDAGRAAEDGRSLRVGDDNDEERAWGDLSSIRSKVRNFFSRKGGQAQRPAAASPERESIDETVKKWLGMGGLSDDALKKHPDYVFFRSMDDTNKIAGWKGANLAPHEAWKEAGLEGIHGGKQLSDVVFTKEFADYASYINTLDNLAVQKWRSTGKVDVVNAASTPEELAARVAIMAAEKRDAQYVKAVLGLTGDKFKSHPNYKIYEDYYLHATT